MRYLTLYRVFSETFHARIKPVTTFLLFQVRLVLSSVTMALDNLVFPGFRKKSLDRPIFIIGNPRSGTTFLHRLLLGAGEMASFELWEQLFPAITARKLLGRIVPSFDKLNPAKYHASDVHDTSMRGIETDDLLWFFRTLDGPFAWAYFLAWKDTWGSDSARKAFGIGDVPEGDEDKFFTYHEACWKRNLHLKRKGRILVKSSMLTFRLKALLKRYPDCKLIYIVRDPVEVIPSGISLLTGVLESAYDIENTTSSDARAHWLENLYQASAAMMEGFHEEYTRGCIPEKNLIVVRYSDLIQNLTSTMASILKFIEIDAPEEFLSEVREQDARQRGHVSKHGYSPDKFGLSAERIRDDLSYVYSTFGLEKNPVQ